MTPQPHPLFHSLNAWRKSKDFIIEAKKSQCPEDRAIYERLAALWMAEHEMYQAIYWAGVRIAR